MARRADFTAAVTALAVDGPAKLQASLASRAARAWTLARPRPSYAGVFSSAALGTMEIQVTGNEISACIGPLSGIATPFTEPESVRVELVLGQGDVIRFAPDGEVPDSLVYGGERFERQPAAKASRMICSRSAEKPVPVRRKS